MTTSKPKTKRQVGFMNGQIKVPDDFDHLYADEIIALFGGDDMPTVAEAGVPDEDGTE